MKKALSPLVSATILVVIALSIAAIIAPWMYELVTSTTNQTGSDLRQDIKCRNAGLDFDSNYGYYGADWNFTGNGTDWLKVKVVNTGNVDLFGFSFEITLDSQSGEEIKHYDPTTATEIPDTNPLRPSRSAIIDANITQDINSSISTLKAVRVLNSVCSGLSAYLLV
jgi:hypothetical protein